MLIELSPQWRRRAIEDGIACARLVTKRNGKRYGDTDSETLRAVTQEEWETRSAFGQVAQCGICKLFGRPWKPEVGTKNPIDVDGIINVRGRLMPSRYSPELPIKPDKDQDEIPTVLVYVWPPFETDGRIEARGWLYGAEAKRRGRENHTRLWKNDYKCWFIPPPYRTMESLLGMYPRDHPLTGQETGFSTR